MAAQEVEVSDHRELFSSVLKTRSIKTIYYVDDAHDSSVNYLPKITATVLKLADEEKLDTLVDLKIKLELDELDAQIINGKIAQLWSQLTVKDQFDYYTKILKANKDTTELEKAAVKSVLEIGPFKEFIKFLSPTEWIAQRNEILAGVNDANRIVVMMDQELGLPGNTKGIDWLKEIPSSENTYLTLFTYSITQLNEEVSTRNDFHRDKDFPKKSFFVLTKDRAKNHELFIDGVKKVLLNTYFDQMKEKALKIYSDSFESTKIEIDNIDTHDFDMTVLKSSMKEGLWEPETLFRILKIFLEKNIRRQMIEQNFPSDVNSLIKTAKTISESHQYKEYNPEYSKNYIIRHNEIYDGPEIINELRMPIENGDIFEVTVGAKTHQYILIGQECDLMLRSDSSITNFYASIFKIEMIDIPRLVEKINEFKSKYPLKDYMANRFKMEYFERGKKTLGLIRLSDEIVVDRRILDLTTLNVDGVSRISLTNPISESDLSYSQYRHINTIKSFIAREKRKQEIPGTPITSLKIQFSFLSKIKDEYALIDNSIEFGVKRVMRFRKPYSKFLLEKYHHLKNRNAEDHDFADH
jgi:hypothetical protein